MPRRQVLRANRFGAAHYLVNVGQQGLFLGPLRALIERIEYVAANGRWYALHLRYVLGEGFFHEQVLGALRHRLKSKQGGLHYVWSVEQSLRAKRLDGTAHGEHHHLALLVNGCPNNITRVGHKVFMLQREGFLRSYHLIRPDLQQLTPELAVEVNHADLRDACTPYGLALTNEAAIRFGVYWLSYICKVATKVTDRRSFGASALKPRRVGSGKTCDDRRMGHD